MHMRNALACIATLAAALSGGCGNSTEPSGRPNIVVVPDTVRLGRGDSTRLTAVPIDDAGRTVPGVILTYASSDSTTVRVRNSGWVRSVGPVGSAIVTVSGQIGTELVSRPIPAFVTAIPRSIVVAPADTTIPQEGQVQLRTTVRDGLNDPVPNPSLMYESLNPAVLTVSTTGRVTTTGPAGTGVVVVHAGSLVDSARVTVTAVADSVAISPAAASIYLGDSVQFSGTVYDRHGDVMTGASISWTSLSTPVATISSSGVARAQNIGIADIRAQAGFVSVVATLFVLDSSVVARLPLGGAPFGSAVSAPGVGWVGQPQLGQVSRLDITAGTITGTVRPGPWPVQISANADGSRIYVPSFQSNAMVTSTNTATGQTVDIVLATANPEDAYAVTNTPAGDTVFVGITNGPLFKVHMTSRRVLGTLSLPVAAGYHFEWNKTRTRLYASQRGFDGGRVFEIDPVSFTLLRTFETGGSAQDIQLSADDSKLFVAAQQGGVIVWDVTSNSRDTTYATPGCSGYGLLRTPDNTRLYVGCVFEGRVLVLDPATGALIASVTVGRRPRELSYDASTRRLIVPNEGGWVDIIQ